jgi:hypothetical protein
VDVAARPQVGGRIAFVPTPGHSPDHAALILAAGMGKLARGMKKIAGETGVIISGGEDQRGMVRTVAGGTHPHWNSAFCGDPRQAEASRREMMAWGASHHAQWFPLSAACCPASRQR